jgi:hypothetical protein
MTSRALCTMLLALLGCGDDTVPGGGPTGSGHSATKVIGAQGGQVSLEGVVLMVPPDALASDQMIVITSTAHPPPAQFARWSSPVYQFEPAGLTFSVPATVSLSFTAQSEAQSIYWSSSSGSTFENLGGSASGNVMTTSVIHFSQGFVAPRAGAPPADASPGPTDAGVDQVIDGGATPDAPVGGAVDALVDAPMDAAIDAATDAAIDAAAAPDASCLAVGQPCGSPSECCSSSCVGGSCTGSSCAAGLTLCGGSCVDLSSDRTNCGVCGHACLAAEVCVNRTCGILP